MNTATSTSSAPPTLKAAEQLQQMLCARLQGNEHHNATAEIVRIAAELTGALGVVYLSRDAEQRLGIHPEHFAPSNLTHLQSLLQHVMRLGTIAAAENSPQAGTTEADPNLLVAAVPVTGASSGMEALAMAMSVESPSQSKATSAYLIQILTWVAATISSQRQRQVAANPALDDAPLRDVNAMLWSSSKQNDADARNRNIAAWVKHNTNSDEVLLGLRKSGQCRVVAYTGHETFDSRSARIRAAEELCDEIIIAAENELLDSVVRNTGSATELKRLAAKELGQQLVLRDPAGKPFGVILCLNAQSTPNQPLSEEVLRIVALQLHTMQQAEPTFLKRLLTHGDSARSWLRQPAFWLGTALLGLAMLIPSPLKVGTSCVVQPKQPRFLSVPYEGRLERAFTKPGDVVTVGQVLAKMDSREIAWEASTLHADLRRAEKNRDAALVDADTSAAQIAGLEAERLQLQIDELDERLANLEIRSPVAGVVVSGDPQKLEGSRFSIGETLLEVAPLSEMLVELEIPDEDISHVKIGQPVRYRFDSAPLSTRSGTVETIHPRSELRENENVYVAYVEIENANGKLRPGMRGRAKIVCDSHCVGWNLFHKAWHRAAGFAAW